MSVHAINLAINTSKEFTTTGWKGYNDTLFSSTLSTADGAMEETQNALIYALNQAMVKGNSNKIQEFLQSNLCSKQVISPRWERKTATWSTERKLAAKPEMTFKRIAQGSTFLKYLRAHALLAHYEVSEETGDRVYVDGPLTLSKGKLSLTKEGGKSDTHWRKQVDGMDLDALFKDMESERWYQFAKPKTPKTKVDPKKALSILAKKVVKATLDHDDDLSISEQQFLDIAKAEYQAAWIKANS